MQYKSLSGRLSLALAGTSLAASVVASPRGVDQRTFGTPREATQALLIAAEADDVAALKNIFGPESEEILSSGDTVQNKNDRARFVERAKQSLKKRIDRTDANHATLLIGADSFPFPIPLERTAGRLFRYVGGQSGSPCAANRLERTDAIAACKAMSMLNMTTLLRPQQEWGTRICAQADQLAKLDGLFWLASDTPLTQFSAEVKKAPAKGYRKEGDTPTPYHGSYFRILTAQGPMARGGAWTTNSTA